MPKYTVDGPDGKKYSIDGPEGATQDQVVEAIKAQMRSKGQDIPGEAGSAPEAQEPLALPGTKSIALSNVEEIIGPTNDQMDDAVLPATSMTLEERIAEYNNIPAKYHEKMDQRAMDAVAKRMKGRLTARGEKSKSGHAGRNYYKDLAKEGMRSDEAEAMYKEELAKEMYTFTQKRGINLTRDKDGEFTTDYVTGLGGIRNRFRIGLADTDNERQQVIADVAGVPLENVVQDAQGRWLYKKEGAKQWVAVDSLNHEIEDWAEEAELIAEIGVAAGVGLAVAGPMGATMGVGRTLGAAFAVASVEAGAATTVRTAFELAESAVWDQNLETASDIAARQTKLALFDTVLGGSIAGSLATAARFGNNPLGGGYDDISRRNAQAQKDLEASTLDYNDAEFVEAIKDTPHFKNMSQAEQERYLEFPEEYVRGFSLGVDKLNSSPFLSRTIGLLSKMPWGAGNKWKKLADAQKLAVNNEVAWVLRNTENADELAPALAKMYTQTLDVMHKNRHRALNVPEHLPEDVRMKVGASLKNLVVRMQDEFDESMKARYKALDTIATGRTDLDMATAGLNPYVIPIPQLGKMMDELGAANKIASPDKAKYAATEADSAKVEMIVRRLGMSEVETPAERKLVMGKSGDMEWQDVPAGKTTQNLGGITSQNYRRTMADLRSLKLKALGGGTADATLVKTITAIEEGLRDAVMGTNGKKALAARMTELGYDPVVTKNYIDEFESLTNDYKNGIALFDTGKNPQSTFGHILDNWKHDEAGIEKLASFFLPGVKGTGSSLNETYARMAVQNLDEGELDLMRGYITDRMTDLEAGIFGNLKDVIKGGDGGNYDMYATLLGKDVIDGMFMLEEGYKKFQSGYIAQAMKSYHDGIHGGLGWSGEVLQLRTPQDVVKYRQLLKEVDEFGDTNRALGAPIDPETGRPMFDTGLPLREQVEEMFAQQLVTKSMTPFNGVSSFNGKMFLSELSKLAGDEEAGKKLLKEMVGEEKGQRLIHLANFDLASKEGNLAGGLVAGGILASIFTGTMAISTMVTFGILTNVATYALQSKAAGKWFSREALTDKAYRNYAALGLTLYNMGELSTRTGQQGMDQMTLEDYERLQATIEQDNSNWARTQQAEIDRIYGRPSMQARQADKKRSEKVNELKDRYKQYQSKTL